MTEEKKEYLTLEFDTEDGGIETVEYVIQDFITVGRQEYIVLVQADREDAIEFYRYDELDDGDVDLTQIEEDAEFEAVVQALRKQGYHIEYES